MDHIQFIEISDEEITDFHRYIANKVKEIRTLKGVSQLDLALSIGHKSMSTIGKIEAGLEGKHYNVEQLYKIAKALDIKVKDIIDK